MKVKPRNVPFQPNMEDKTKIALFTRGYLENLEYYRRNRHRPKNPLYYVAKLNEEAGELAEATLAHEGSKRKQQKLARQNYTPRQKMTEELGDVLNIVFLLAEQFDIPFTEILESAGAKLEHKRQNIHG